MKKKLYFLSLLFFMLSNLYSVEQSSLTVSPNYINNSEQLASDIKHITVDVHLPILEKHTEKCNHLFSPAYVAYLNARAVTHPVLLFYVLKYNLWDGIKVRDTYWNLMEWYINKDLKDFYLHKYHVKYQLNTNFVNTLREVKKQNPDIRFYPASNSGPDTMRMILEDEHYKDLFTGENALFATSENLLNREKNVILEAGWRYYMNLYLLGKETPENLFHKYVEQKQNPKTFDTIIKRINKLNPNIQATSKNCMHIDDSPKKSPKNWAATLLYKTADSARLLCEQYGFLKSKQD